MPLIEIAIGITLGLGSMLSLKKYTERRAVIQPVQAAQQQQQQQQQQQHTPRAEEPAKPTPTYHMSDFDLVLYNDD